MGCLALNASFEPLTILPVERALRLVIDSKAEVLEVDSTRVFRSARQELPCPAVIRLVRFVHVPRRFRRQVTNTFLFARDRYRCQYCGRHRSSLRGREFLTRDHVVPLSRGGVNSWENVVTACSTCNNRKASHSLSECGMHLLRAPTEPNYVELVWAVRRITDVQAKYIALFYGDSVLTALRQGVSPEAAIARSRAGGRPGSSEPAPGGPAQAVAASALIPPGLAPIHARVGADRAPNAGG